MTDRWMDRLSEYLDGDLAPGERTALEAHLADCHACRATLHDLRQVVNRAHALVDRPAGAELWSGIATRIGASGAPVVDLAARRARHRITLSIPQLAAAAVLLVAAGAGATSLALRAPSPPPSAVAVTAAPDVRAIPAGLPGKAEASFDTAVRELEQALAAGRSRLSPKTVTILERNLARIDVAIEEARAALEADPANAYLNAHLANTMQQKLLLLQQANTLASAAS